MSPWICRWRELRRLRRETRAAYGRWTRARHTYHDTAVVFAGEPGAWWSAGPCSKAQDEVADRMNEYLHLSAQLRRMEETA